MSVMQSASKVVKRVKFDPLVLATIILVFIFLILFVMYPLIKVVVQSVINNQGKVSIEGIREILRNKYYFVCLFNSFRLAVTVAVISTIVGYILAFAMTKVNIPLKGVFKNLVIIPMISPPFILALSMIFLFGRQGVITRQLLGIRDFSIFGLKGLVAAETIEGIPIAFLSISAMLENMDPAVEDAAVSLGAERLHVFRTVTLPLSLSGLASAFLLVMIESLTDFGNPIVLGGNYNVLSVSIYSEMTNFYNLTSASILSLMLLIPTILLFIIQRYYISRRSYITVTGKPSYQGKLIMDKQTVKIFFTFCALFAAIIVTLFGIVIFGSFTNTWGVNLSLTLKHYKYAFALGFDSLKNSLEISLISAIVGGLLGVIIAFLIIRESFFGKKIMESLTLLTYTIPGIVVGVGYVLAFNKPPISINGTGLILFIALLFRNIPVAVESGISTLLQIDPSIEDASTTLGASAFTTFRKITLPLLSSPLLSGMIYEFVRAMTATSSVILLVSARWMLMPVVMYSNIEAGDFATASAQVTVMLVIILVVIYVGRSLAKRGGKINYVID